MNFNELIRHSVSMDYYVPLLCCFNRSQSYCLLECNQVNFQQHSKGNVFQKECPTETLSMQGKVSDTMTTNGREIIRQIVLQTDDL